MSIPLPELRRLSRNFLIPRKGIEAWLLRALLTIPKFSGGFTWFVGIHAIDSAIDTPAEITYGGLTRRQFVDHTTRVFDCLAGVGEAPEAVEVVETDLPMILVVREGMRLCLDVRAAILECWTNYVPDALRQLDGHTFPTDEIGRQADRTNHFYGLVWSWLMGVPYQASYDIWEWLSWNIFEVDNLADLEDDIRDGCCHYSLKRLRDARIDPDLLAKAKTWDRLQRVPGLKEWLLGLAQTQVENWSGRSKSEMVRMFSLVPGPMRHLTRPLAWLFARLILMHARKMEAFIAGWPDLPAMDSAEITQ
jgi:hypothetical protein